ncbi:MAG: hypothetical protein UU93_C0006G0025 [Candidatus Amesbacteria bacterium GW2011_GWA2_42_12]|uniref:Carrier domain-containing protein n=1 Tax=Candidatus Amesbacteria bacterium GW2011_GWA2_42_12 TaxID=1618356 RepID=A0A0G1AEI9_9BACT|nr:MAG: hypothetical protein UU93_C0006G0025 [Candidatus Amesbacteria bacterium GW2011_GWA2_42_12]
MQLSKAILEFLSDDLHLSVDSLTPETSFADLGLSPVQTQNLLSKMQDALGMILPEDKIATILTIGDLLNISEEE